MKNENEQSLEVYKNILFVESNKYTILPNKLASIKKKSSDFFFRESKWCSTRIELPPRVHALSLALVLGLWSRVTGTGQCIVDVHAKKTTGAFLFTRFLSFTFFFLIVFLFMYFFFSLFQQTSEYKR